MDLQQAKADITDGLSQEQLKEQVTSEHIRKISLEMTKWEDWGSALELTPTQIEDIDRENRTMHTKRLAVLQVWEESFGSAATYEKLFDTLLKFKMRKMAAFVCSLLKTPSVAIPSQEYDTFLLHYSKVVDAIQDPVPLATRLFDRGIIDRTVLQNVTYPGQPRFKNTHILLSAVKGRIQTNPTTFQVFLSALKEDTSLQSLVESMEGKCFICYNEVSLITRHSHDLERGTLLCMGIMFSQRWKLWMHALLTCQNPDRVKLYL